MQQPAGITDRPILHNTQVLSLHEGKAGDFYTIITAGMSLIRFGEIQQQKTGISPLNGTDFPYNLQTLQLLKRFPKI